MVFAAEMKMGFLRRACPTTPWPLVAGATFRPLTLPRLAPGPEPEADEIVQGVFRPFSGAPKSCGMPPDWHRNILSGETLPDNRHWTEIEDFGGADIKGVWELSRWGWAFPLGRAYLRTGDDRYTDAFLRLAIDWMERNPPNLGPQWKCGQEASLRLMAAAWALSAFQGSPRLTPEILGRFASLAQITAQRVQCHLAYALSQDNNHGISELAGLITAGALWPGSAKSAQRVDRACDQLAAVCERLFAADGSFSQHSSNYHRVALDGLCWTAAVARATGIKLPPAVLAAGKRASTFLWHILDPSGGAFRYGSDDGAYIMPLTGAPYADFRPTLAASAVLFSGPSPGPGPWQTQAELLGLAPNPAPQATVLPAVDLFDGGLHVRRGPGWAIFFRCPTRFCFRPSHADQLHVSIWCEGEPVAEDPGTWSYNLPGKPWANFCHARYHNVPCVDEADPMRRVSRFLWLPWSTCELHACSDDRLIASNGSIPGFQITREIRLDDDMLIVTDKFVGRRRARLSTRWTSPRSDALREFMLDADVPGPTDITVIADKDSGLGIHCAAYGHPGVGATRVFSVKASCATIRTSLKIKKS